MTTSNKRMTSSTGKSTSGNKSSTSSRKGTTSSKKGANSSRKRKAGGYSEWFRSTGEPQTGIIVLSRGVPQGVLKQVEYSAIDGMAIFEGDILLGTVDELQATVGDGQPDLDAIPASGIRSDEPSVRGLVVTSTRTPDGVMVVGQQFRWPGARFIYEIDPNLPNQERVTKAMKHWEEKTKIRFVKRIPSDPKHKNFVRFEDQGGCFSQVGMRGGKQIISLGAGCGLGAAIHEIGHAVGLWHEQSREDRSKFVRILFQNIEPGREHNFNQHIADGDDVGTYDYGSIMHYPATAFSKNGQPTIVPLKSGGNQIGQRSGLSVGDIAAVKFMYP